MITDSHAHLDMAEFDRDRADVLARARDAGLEFILAIGTGNPESASIERTINLAENYDFVYAGIGVHPHDAKLADEVYWQRMELWARHPRVVVWGEIGLDYYYDHSPREVQQQVFRRQLRIARRLELPVSIHCRDAWEDLETIVREEWPSGSPGAILHSFTGSADSAMDYASRGFLISFSGIVTFKNASSLREAARRLPLDRILVETDCPYLAPVPHRGKRNEPAFVADVLRGLAEAREIEFMEIARSTCANLKQFLGMTW